MLNDHANFSWKGPTVRDIAEVAGGGPAALDQVRKKSAGVP